MAATLDPMDKEAAMQSIPDDVRIFHIRNRCGQWPDGRLLNKGGITVAVKVDGNRVFGAIGICGFKRPFYKKRGVEVSVGRLLLLVSGDYPLFSRAFDLSRFGSDTDEERALCIAHILVADSRLKGRQKRTAMEAIRSTRLHAAVREGISDEARRRKEAREEIRKLGILSFDIEGSTTGRYDCSRTNAAHPGGIIEKESGEEQPQ